MTRSLPSFSRICILTIAAHLAATAAAAFDCSTTTGELHFQNGKLRLVCISFNAHRHGDIETGMITPGEGKPNYFGFVTPRGQGSVPWSEIKKITFKQTGTHTSINRRICPIYDIVIFRRNGQLAKGLLYMGTVWAYRSEVQDFEKNGWSIDYCDNKAAWSQLKALTFDLPRVPKSAVNQPPPAPSEPMNEIKMDTDRAPALLR